MWSLATLLSLLAVAEGANVVSMNIARNPAAEGKILNSRRIGKRSTVTESLSNNLTAGSYLATVKVGTPPQTMTLAIDTGSSDVWVLSSKASICESGGGDDTDGECTLGTFNANKSSTFDDILPGGFEIEYDDGSKALGDYFTDDFTFGNATVKSLQIGLGAGKTTINSGIMGIGYDTNEATLDSGESKYPNLIDELVSQNLINIEAYSLWLDDLNSSTGSILFGGIDTAKYTGSLISIPIQSDPSSGSDVISSFTVALTSLTVKNGSTTIGTYNNATDSSSDSDDADSWPVAVILDSGTTLTYIPDSLAADIYNLTGAIDDSDESGYVLIDCDMTDDLTFNYQFGGSSGPTISVALNELNMGQVPLETTAFENACMFGIMPGGTGPYLLGDTFLRSAYAVYDLKNNEIGLAQTNFNSEGSNVVEFSSTASGIPEEAGVASGVSVTQTATGQPGVGGKSTGSLNTMTSVPASLPVSTSVSTSVSGSASVPSKSASGTSVSGSSSLPSSSASETSETSVSGSTSSPSNFASGTSKSAAVGSVPPFNVAGLVVLTISAVFSLVGGAWFIL